MQYLHNSYFCYLFLCPLQDSDDEEMNRKYLIFKNLFYLQSFSLITRWTILRTIENFWYSSHKMECISENVAWIPYLDMDFCAVLSGVK